MIPLDQARKLAARILNELTPYCDRIEIAGSIRRQRPQVTDIDLVAIPKDFAALLERVKRNCQILQEGKQNLLCRLANGLDLDLWLARPRGRDVFGTTPSTWGTLFLCRTGSTQHNINLVEHAKRLGLRWNPYEGVFSKASLIASETEEEIFRALKLPFAPPERRDPLSQGGRS